MERRWAWLTKCVLEDHWKQRMLCTAATKWGCVGWYGWARLFRSTCTSISCQETEVRSALYEEPLFFTKQILQWEHTSQEVVMTCLASSQMIQATGSSWRFGTSLLVCLYIRKMTLQEKGWIQILSQIKCVSTGASVTGICCRGEQGWKHLVMLLRPSPDHNGSIYTSNISWVNIEMLRRS